MTKRDGLFSRPGIDISVTKLSKNYRVGEVNYPALTEVDCEIKKGAVTIIQGPSGCGKSTFLNMLGGVDRPDRGLLQVGDKELSKQMTEGNLSNYRLYEVGFVFQAFNLIPGLTAQENLALPMTVAGKKHAQRVERAQALLELVGMREKASKRPDELSGGEQQRVAISLALVNDPLLILADEPTGNLDSGNAMIVADLLCSLAHDYEKTVIIATHDPAVGSKGDLVFQMRDGTLLPSLSV
ncbi:ABC transporter ATP-binding protein [Acidobacteria bacterium AH-259-D05]|nr:ABC transporter ATP-binding protein [Acidobacteria bacterium AH-259-D05]